MGRADGPEYPVETVERLLGLHEDPGRSGERDITIVDVLSWARDPGGPTYFHRRLEFEEDMWRWRRGPLDPDSELACVLFDFMRAMNEMDLARRAVIALKAFGLSDNEIASVVDTRRVIELENIRLSTRSRDHRELNRRARAVNRIVTGYPKRGQDGEPVKDEHEQKIYVGGLAQRLAHAMNDSAPECACCGTRIPWHARKRRGRSV